MNDILLNRVAETLKRRAEHFECFQVQRRELSASFEAGKLKSAQTSQRSGLGLRVAVGGKLACGGTSDPAAVDRMLDSVIEAAAFGDPFEFELSPPAAAPPVDAHSAGVAGLGPADLVATAGQVVGALGDVGGSATVSVSVDAGEDGQTFINSRGHRYAYRTTHYGVAVSIEFFGQDDIFSVWEYDETSHGGIDIDALVRCVREKFKLAENIVAAGPAEQTLVFTPAGLQALLVPLLAGLNGQNVVEGISPLGEKLGQLVVSDKLTLVDDSTLAGRPGSQPFDDEGVPARRTVLIDRGRVGNFLLDLRTAAKLNRPSTANASRGITSPPSPQPSNLAVSPGDRPYERLIGEVADGLLVESLLGVGQGNVVGGDYANPIGLAYKIRDGRILGRVKNCSLAGNVYDDLQRVTAIEDRAHWRGSLCAPHVRLDGMHVAAGE